MVDKMKCCKKPHRSEKFIKICLLTLLYNKTSHGYSLIEGLAQYGFDKEDLSISTLYRNLRRMEKEGLVISSWKEGSGGPRKRVYSITKKGKENLSEYIDFLKYRKSLMTKLINNYEDKVKRDNREEL
jgi:DNA-binding PadR family transcriptional regulator